MKKEIEVKLRSVENLGIQDSTGTWWNYPRDVNPLAIADTQKKLKELTIGSIIEIETKADGRLINFDIVKKAEFKPISTKKEIQKFEDLIKKAKNKLAEFSVDTNLTQISDAYWIAKTTVSFAGSSISAHGDASEQNVDTHMKNMLPRLAETRALSRALRLALGDWVGEE